MFKYFILLFISLLISNSAIPSYTITSKPGKMKFEIASDHLHPKIFNNYNSYYYDDGNGFSVDLLDCGLDGICPGDCGTDNLCAGDFGYTVPDEDGSEYILPDDNGTENDGINGMDVYISNGTKVNVMYHGTNGMGFDFHLFEEQRKYDYLASILKDDLSDHPYYDYALEFGTKEDLTHYNLGIYYVWNEIKGDNSLINNEQYTFPSTRILSGLYYKAINTEDNNFDAIYNLTAMDFIISNNLILSNQLIFDLSDSDDISPSSLSSKLIYNMAPAIAFASSYTYKQYSDESYESFFMFESAVQLLNLNHGNFNSNIKVSPYAMVSLGGKNVLYSKNEFGLNLKVFFN